MSTGYRECSMWVQGTGSALCGYKVQGVLYVGTGYRECSM